MRGSRPIAFTNMRSGDGLDTVVAFVKQAGGLATAA
jgi:hypothetical protein